MIAAMMTLAETLVALGGDRAVAERLGINRPAVRNWRMRKVIPAHFYPALAEMADEQGVELDPDLFRFGRRKPWANRSDEHGTATQDG